MTIILFILGLVLLIVGAEVLVRGASRLAVAIGISPLVVGLTVVSYGTSSPELAVGIQSSLVGQADIVMGNVIGSNICNVLLILGLSALAAPLLVSSQLVRLDVPLMIGVSGLTYFMARDGLIGRMDGLILVSMAIIYTIILIRLSRGEKHVESSIKPSKTHWSINLLMIGIGLGMLAVGSDWLVDGAVIFAKHLGISELIIGLTIVAGGTSLPELATSVIASFRGERDIAVGNVIGSNIFNIMGVLGTSAVVSVEGIRLAPTILTFDLPIMVMVAVVCLPFFFTNYEISRWEGGLFFGYYLIYVVYLILDATQQPILRTYSHVILFFIIPLTSLFIIITLMKTLLKKTR